MSTEQTAYIGPWVHGTQPTDCGHCPVRLRLRHVPGHSLDVDFCVASPAGWQLVPEMNFQDGQPVLNPPTPADDVWPLTSQEDLQCLAAHLLQIILHATAVHAVMESHTSQEIH